ncbi:MAG: twin-arginine translocase subunit TatC [Phycisphaerales bacterium JB039]
MPSRSIRDAHEQFSSMPLGDHLEELRARLILALGGLVAVFIPSLLVAKNILALLIAPVQRQLRAAGQPPNLQATGVLETFASYMYISLVAAVLLGSPWIIWQLWRFVAPGLYRSERRFAYLLAPMSFFMTVCSCLFLYFVMLPVVLAFFIGFGTSVGAPEVPVAPLPEGVALATSPPMLEADPEQAPPGTMWINTVQRELRIALPRGNRIEIMAIPLAKAAGIVQQYRISEYVRLILHLAMAFAIAFQTPIVVLLLTWAGIVDPKALGKYRKHAVMGCAIAGAILTPADPISMMVLAMPLYLLYELGLILARVLPAERVAGPRPEEE